MKWECNDLVEKFKRSSRFIRRGEALDFLEQSKNDGCVSSL